MKTNINKKSILLLSFIVLCVFILLLFFIPRFRPAKITSISTNIQSGWHSFTKAGQYITAITWDKNNNLWVAGEEFGVSLIDEKVIKTFDIPYCYSIVCDNDGKVWIGTLRQGLYSYDNGKWQNYNVSNGLPSNSIHALAIDKNNNLYCASGLNLSKLSGNSWQTIPLPSITTMAGKFSNFPNSEISCIDFDRKGNLWIGFSLGGIAQFDGRDWILYTQKDGLDLDGRVNDILVDKVGTIWVAACQGLGRSTSGTKDISFSVYKFEPIDKGYSEKEDPMGWSYYPANYFTSIAEDELGNVFFANRHDPVRRWNIHDSRFMPFVSQYQLPPQEQSLSRNYFYCVTVDKDGYVWVGSYGGGIITNNSWFKLPQKIIKVPITPEEKINLLDSSKQPKQKELIAKTYKLLKESPLKEQAYYIGEDWLTQGNWIGNYGEYAWILCGYYHFPTKEWASDLIGGSDRSNIYNFKHIMWHTYIGENADANDYLRSYMPPDWGLITDNPKIPQDPLFGGKFDRGCDDHAEAYPRPLIREGPHIYLDLDILEEGIFIVSFYYMNFDGHEGEMNKFRDFIISVKRKTSSEKEFANSPLLASCRVNDFLAGVYKSFMLKGPAKYTLKFDKKESFNTSLGGTFIDKVEAGEGL